MIGLALMILYIAYVSGFGSMNISTSIHNSADFLFWWYIAFNGLGTFLMSTIGVICTALAIAPTTKETDSKACALGAGAMLILVPWTIFKTVLLGVGTWLISLGVPVESSVSEWDWTKVLIGAALVLFTLVCLRTKQTNTNTEK